MEKLRALNDQQAATTAALANSVPSLNHYDMDGHSGGGGVINQQHIRARNLMTDTSTHGSRTIDSRFSRDKVNGLSDEEDNDENEEEDEEEDEDEEEENEEEEEEGEEEEDEEEDGDEEEEIYNKVFSIFLQCSNFHELI